MSSLIASLIAGKQYFSLPASSSFRIQSPQGYNDRWNFENICTSMVTQIWQENARIGPERFEDLASRISISSPRYAVNFVNPVLYFKYQILDRRLFLYSDTNQSSL